MLLNHLWSDAFKVKMSYETKIFESFLKNEQRRALRTFPKIEIHKKIMLELSEAREILMKDFNTTVFVPLDSEPFVGTRGTNKITSTTSLTNFFFLKNLNNVYVIDDDGNTAKITSVVGNVINLSANIGGTSNQFYTCFKCFVKSLPFSYETDTIVSLNVVFEQVKEA